MILILKHKQQAQTIMGLKHASQNKILDADLVLDVKPNPFNL